MTPPHRPRLGFIGPGTVGTALARSLAGAGYRVVALYGRGSERLARAVEKIPRARAASSAQQVVDTTDLVFLTVPDGAIRLVARSLEELDRKAVVHCSGADSLSALEPAAARGASVGALHPLQTFASVEQAMRNLPGSAFAVEASSPELEQTLVDMAHALGGRSVTLAGDKALYHASAVLASNYVVTLIDVAASLWTRLGLTQEEGLRALLPLVRGTIENLEAVGLPNALTGPVSRGDIETVEKNLSALRAVSPQTAELYVELARRTISIAQAKGTLGEEAAARLRERLDAARPSVPQEAR